MPQLGESIVEATLVRWHVAPGATVARGQVIAEVETDKATNEIPAPEAGVIGEILIQEGTTVPVGTEILRYREGSGAAVRAPLPSARPAPAPAPAAAAQTAPTKERRLPSAHLAPRPLGSDGRERRASPSVRKIARAQGIDLASVVGTGKHGRIRREDVLAQEAAAKPAPLAAVAPAPSSYSVYRPTAYEPEPGDQVIPFSRRRTFIAEHMVHSLGTAAHVAAVVEIDMHEVVRARARDKSSAEREGVKLTVTAYVVHAVAQALSAHPELNASVVGSSHVLRRAKNIGVAVDTKDGLIVPVVRRADEHSLLGLARAIEALTKKAQSGTLTAADLAGGSFTISNPGRDGNLFGISILRQPEVGILRIGEVQKRAVVRTIDGEDVIVIRPIMFAALSYDHRVIDGSTGNAFLHEVRARLEGAQPALAGESSLPSKRREP
jgi:2-oxoglutarate dehydrogenase E2 component (dihydrolipoamide succinyltransferase)